MTVTVQTETNPICWRTSETTNLEDAIVYLNEGEKVSAEYPVLFNEICRSGRIMLLGYDCYPHMLLASGQADLVIDFELKPYDYFALVPIVEGAGGVISDWRGRKTRPGIRWRGS